MAQDFSCIRIKKELIKSQLVRLSALWIDASQALELHLFWFHCKEPNAHLRKLRFGAFSEGSRIQRCNACMGLRIDLRIDEAIDLGF